MRVYLLLVWTDLQSHQVFNYTFINKSLQDLNKHYKSSLLINLFPIDRLLVTAIM